MIHDGRSLGAALTEATRALEDPRDRAFVQACVYTCLRHVFSLRAWLATLLHKPLRRKDGAVETLLLAGLCQLRHLDVAPHAVVSASVAATAALGRPWARGLVNGVLRNAARGTPPEPADEQARREHPAWLVEALRTAWPGDFEAIVSAANAPPPMTLRVNRLRGSRSDYAAQLAAAGIDAHPTRHAPDGLRLAAPVPVDRLPGFEAGSVSVQDEAAQLAAGLLGSAPGERVLDACAAPGGKTAHLLEQSAGPIDLTALDVAPARLADVAATLERLDLACTLRAADAGATDAWWDGAPFDRILLDAPCSATGVIRRHPDIRLHRRASDIPAMTRAQRRLLGALWPLLRPGGRLLYATCSIMPEENDAVVVSLREACPDMNVVPIAGPWGRATALGRQILPGDEEMDGFYYALLEKDRPDERRPAAPVSDA